MNFIFSLCVVRLMYCNLSYVLTCKIYSYIYVHIYNDTCARGAESGIIYICKEVCCYFYFPCIFSDFRCHFSP